MFDSDIPNRPNSPEPTTPPATEPTTTQEPIGDNIFPYDRLLGMKGYESGRYTLSYLRDNLYGEIIDLFQPAMVIFNLFYQPIKSQLLGMKYVLKHQEFKKLCY